MENRYSAETNVQNTTTSKNDHRITAYFSIALIILALLTLLLWQECFVYKIVGNIYTDLGEAINENGETYIEYGYEEVPCSPVGYNILFGSDNAGEYELEPKNSWVTLSYIVVGSLLFSVVIIYLWSQKPEKYGAFWLTPIISIILLYLLQRWFNMEDLPRLHYEGGNYQGHEIEWYDAQPSTTNLIPVFLLLGLAFLCGVCAKLAYNNFKKEIAQQAQSYNPFAASFPAPQANNAAHPQTAVYNSQNPWFYSQSNVSSSENPWFCKNCGAENLSSAIFCCQCGTRNVYNSERPWSCKNCGNVNIPSAKFCCQCGANKD